ncbi:LamG-like jellyroll fold domain-containing protein [Phytohabitans kaempferiae]|uniref:LamG-like jellyroll fold domain-containing protein n=1 Tax=Phytohabitans kaempferiae TaxID=1620943 RepID=A0ABV6LWY8_9ACTN
MRPARTSRRTAPPWTPPARTRWRRRSSSPACPARTGRPRPRTARSAVRSPLATPRPATSGEWTHLTGVFDAVAKTVTLYVNGVGVRVGRGHHPRVRRPRPSDQCGRCGGQFLLRVQPGRSGDDPH